MFIPSYVDICHICAMFSSSCHHTWPPSGWIAGLSSWHQLGASPCPASLTGRLQYVQQTDGGGCQHACLWGRRHCRGEAGLCSEWDWDEQLCELQVRQRHCLPRRDPLSQYLHLKQISTSQDNEDSSCFIKLPPKLTGWLTIEGFFGTECVFTGIEGECPPTDSWKANHTDNNLDQKLFVNHIVSTGRLLLTQQVAILNVSLYLFADMFSYAFVLSVIV